MPVPSLPAELLPEIFSSLVSHQSDLLHVCLASRTFYGLAKPLLYYHISITHKEQRDQLKTIKEEDKKLVRKVTIEGTKFERGADLEMRVLKCRVGPGLIEELLSGDLLDVSTIEVLHISHVSGCSPNLTDSIRFKPAPNLLELSVDDHLDGADLFDSFLQAQSTLCPNLKRLGFHDVWAMMYSRSSSANPSSSIVLVGMSLGDVKLSPKTESVVWHPSVNPGLTFPSTIENSPTNLILCRNPTSVDSVIDPPLTSILESGYNAFLTCCELAEIPSVTDMSLVPSVSAFREWLEAIRRRPSRPETTFLSLPYVRSDLSPEHLSLLAEMQKLNTEIYLADDDNEDDRRSISLVPRQFVEFVKRQRAKKEEEEELGRVELEER